MRAFEISESPFDTTPPWDPASGPAHQQIERWLEELILDHTLLPEDRLPPEAELAGHLAVSRMTLRQALARLEEKLLIQRRRGRGGGTFVREPRVDHDLSDLPGFTEQMLRASVRPGGLVVSTTTLLPPDAVRTALGLAAGERAYRVVKVRLANDDPVALEDTYLPAAALPGLLDHDLSGSLYALLSQGYGQVPTTAEEQVEPAVADEHQAHHLGVAPGALLLRVVRTTTADTGLVVEHARDLFRADRARISMRSRISPATAAGLATPGRGPGTGQVTSVTPGA